ncbi:spore gernimation protein GerB [Bacillus canaveralius]|uniref:Spore gernimation protein GerB n=1 Tax=Bacillus canaveralius TaxID=1403243 RepID=A0A2N5GM00_9BACI|nr:GerAB/ArcD/ProY family transporter [Bacillus canaveralius]PLR82892.1 spore gernimation protein GerB [Bacillus canaveralius]PLR97103.1 spore gernimation protein GerB [Bacillus canaveralius]
MLQNESIPEPLKISPFLVFYIVIAMQIGIGILGYQRIIAKGAGYEAWISVLFSGLSLHIIMWLIYKICSTVEGDLVTANIFVFGKKLGKAISTIFIAYFTIIAVTTLRTFIEVIQVWMFPEMSIFWYSLAYLLLVIYIIYGGFRTVVGIAFFGTVLPAYLLLTFAFALKYAKFANMLPLFDHSLVEFLISAYKMSLTYIGFEAILLMYPFIKSPEKSKKWAHLAILTTTLIYTVLTIISFAYFSEQQLQKTIWATLTIWKIVEMPIVERFEYIGIANWNLVILPNICIAVWCASRLIKRIFSFQQKKNVFLIAIICIIVTILIETRSQVDFLNTLTSRIGFAFIYIYIPILYLSIVIAKKVKKG